MSDTSDVSPSSVRPRSRSRSRRRRKAVVAAIFIVGAVIVTVVTLVDRDDAPSMRDGGPAASPPPVASHPHGGSVRVAVATPPEMGDAGEGGDTLRQLVLPKLFEARPDGTWQASLVEPKSDRTADDQMSARFRLRKGSSWSTGAPITVDDLRRSADVRFVAKVDDPDADSFITVHFTQRFPAWRQLWSGASSITSSDPNAYGGPFQVLSVTSGLETVLVRNARWFDAADGPFLDEIHLVVVPDASTVQGLLRSGEIDVASPVADTVRTQQLQRIDGVQVSRAEQSGSWIGLLANPSQLSLEQRRRVMHDLPRAAFVNSLLAGEGTLLDGLIDADDRTWSAVPVEPSDLTSSYLNLTAPLQEPLATLFGRSLQRSVQSAGGALTPQNDEASSVTRKVEGGDYQLALQRFFDGPDVCWTCRWGGVDLALAQQADAGDVGAARRLEAKLRDEARLLPLWRASVLTAYRTAAVNGVEANGYGPGVAWDAARWWKP